MIGEQLEQDVQRVFDWLLNHKGEGIRVERRKKIMGRSGPHEFDVYYEFKRAGITHRVVIECKDHKRRVEKQDIAAFYGKIHDLNDVHNGILISRNGFQLGAVTYASQYGIQLTDYDDLPSGSLLIADRLEAVAFPQEGDIGEPFWSIMGFHNGKFDGTPLGNFQDGKRYRMLFFSKKHAEYYLRHNVKTNEQAMWAVCGLRQYLLRTVLLIAHAMKAEIAITFPSDQPEDGALFAASVMSVRKLAADFHLDPRILEDLERCPQMPYDFGG